MALYIDDPHSLGHMSQVSPLTLRHIARHRVDDYTRDGRITLLTVMELKLDSNLNMSEWEERIVYPMETITINVSLRDRVILHLFWFRHGISCVFGIWTEQLAIWKLN